MSNRELTTAYHVAGRGWTPGMPLKPYSELRNGLGNECTDDDTLVYLYMLDFEASAHVQREGGTLLEVDVTGYRLRQGDEGEWGYRGTIPAERIRVLAAYRPAEDEEE